MSFVVVVVVVVVLAVFVFSWVVVFCRLRGVEIFRRPFVWFLAGFGLAVVQYVSLYVGCSSGWLILFVGGACRWWGLVFRCVCLIGMECRSLGSSSKFRKLCRCSRMCCCPRVLVG